MDGLALIFISLAAAVAQAEVQPADATPDVAIFAGVRARELQFEEVGDVVVDVRGSVNGRPAATVSNTDRDNLPKPVQPRVLYRDIGIRLTITSTLPDIERIVDEALASPPNP